MMAGAASGPERKAEGRKIYFIPQAHSCQITLFGPGCIYMSGCILAIVFSTFNEN